jgi:hypothetical protein
MATRRVKRIKRSKKHVHRARGRKTNHRRRRHTRRQRGGEIITVCERTGSDFFGTAKGIAITYDTLAKTYTVGNQPYEKLKTMPRYTAALDIVRKHVSPVFNDAAPVVLDQKQFDIFKGKYCTAYAPIGGQQCESINGFLPVDSAAPVAAPVAGAAAASAVPKMSRNELMVIGENIAYNNNNGEMKVVRADKSKTEYEFDNFIIPIPADEHDQPGHIISGKLKVKFVPGPQLVTEFILELNVDPTEALIECMNQSVIDTAFVEITNIASSKSIFGASKMVITGTLMEQKDDRHKKSTYDFNSFVMNFAKHYTSCSDLATQMAELRVASPDDVARMIKSKIVMLGNRTNRMSPEEKTRFEALQRQFMTADRTNLALLNQISIEMDKLADDIRARIYPAAKGAKGGKTRRKNRH